MFANGIQAIWIYTIPIKSHLVKHTQSIFGIEH